MAPREEFLATVLPPALELATAYAASEGDPALFVTTMRRVVDESMQATDPSTATAQLLFGMSALCGILLDDLADHEGTDRAAVLAQVHRLYLAS
ncbi:hypothetical protein [Luedemannella helvata]|uniref:TetR family transcriptional regulator n=1 Tax=Luedemannella helvata TaxID=349315 RepID=A0ABP4XAW5_9ACTN